MRYEECRAYCAAHLQSVGSCYLPLRLWVQKACDQCLKHSSLKQLVSYEIEELYHRLDVPLYTSSLFD